MVAAGAAVSAVPGGADVHLSPRCREHSNASDIHENPPLQTPAQRNNAAILWPMMALIAFACALLIEPSVRTEDTEVERRPCDRELGIVASSA